MPIPFASLIPLLAPVVQSGLNFLGDSISARRQRKFAVDAWNQQNEYNSPAAQLQRFKSAGMSPAYGGGISSGNAAPLSQAATTVAKPSFPNMLEVLAQYQSLKNAALEGDRLKAINDGIIIDNGIKQLNSAFLSTTFSDRSMSTKFDRLLKDRAYSSADIDLSFKNALSENGMNPYLWDYRNKIQSYQLGAQKLQQDSELFKINKAIQELTLSNMKLGINQGDNVVLRMLSRFALGDSPLSKYNPFKK